MEITEVAKKLSGFFYLATLDGDQPRVRPFDGAAVVDGKLYIGTANTKKVFNQIKNHPKVEICAFGDLGQIRFAAEAYPEEVGPEKTAEIFDAIGKTCTDTSIAIRLENLQF